VEEEWKWLEEEKWRLEEAEKKRGLEEVEKVYEVCFWEEE
jgi:hypothetical protein